MSDTSGEVTGAHCSFLVQTVATDSCGLCIFVCFLTCFAFVVLDIYSGIFCFMWFASCFVSCFCHCGDGNSWLGHARQVPHH